MAIKPRSDRRKAAGALARLDFKIGAQFLQSRDRRARQLARAALSKGGNAFALKINGQPVTLNGQFITLSPRT